jgi:hypothetical protein
LENDRCLVRALLIRGLVLAGAFGTPLCAQPSFAVGPVFGYYRPTGSFDPASVYVTSLPTQPSDLSGSAWGGLAQVWITRRFGVEAQAAVASSSIGPVITPAGPRGPTPAQVVTVTAQALLNLATEPKLYRLWVSAGPGFVRHGGSSYAQFGSPSNLAAVFGVGFSVPIGAGLSATAGATAEFYQLNIPMPPGLQGNPGSLESGFQKDGLVHVGLTWGRW